MCASVSSECGCPRSSRQGRAPVYGCAGKITQCFNNPWTSGTNCTQDTDCVPYESYSDLVVECADIIDVCVSLPINLIYVARAMLEYSISST